MDLKEIRQLIKFLSATDVSEIEISEGEQTVRIIRGTGSGENKASVQQPAYFFPPPSSQAPEPSVAKQVEVSSSKSTPQTSPMVGTYYHAASPEASAFVSRGDIVKKGQVLCIIEAMKLMNEIESEHAGRVVSVLKENASPVEYGETLFLIEPV